MKTNKFLWAAMMPLAFVACTQDEIVESPSTQIGDAVAQYKGAQLIENPSFEISKDDEGVNGRMATTNGVVDWEAGDKVGLVWLNAVAISNHYSADEPNLSDWYPTNNLHFSNTRITHGENSVFSMQDGQLYAGQYIAYHPYDENMKQVGEFSLKQATVQSQNTSSVEESDAAAFDYLAKNMNWLSRSANNVSGKSSFLYHIDADKAGLVKTIHIPMRRYSNIFETRFVGVEPETSLVKWEDLTIQKVELLASAPTFPQEVTFNFSKGLGQQTYELERDENGNYIEVPATEYDKDGNPIKNYKKDAEGYPAKFVVGLQNVGPTASYPALIDDETENWYENKNLQYAVTLNIPEANWAPVGNNADKQRAMFLLLPTTAAKDVEGTEGDVATTNLSIKIHTDFGYVEIPENEWKSYIGKDPDPVVNGTEWGNQDLYQNYADMLEAGKTAKDLLSLIGQKITRFVAINPDDLVYNDIEVGNMAELTAALKKWNDLGEDGDFRVIVKENNNFENFDWSVNSENEEIRRFLGDNDDYLIISGKKMYLNGTTTLADPKHNNHACDGHLTINTDVEQQSGAMNVEADETVKTIGVSGELNIKEGVTLNTKETIVRLGCEANIDGKLTSENNVRNIMGIVNVAGEIECGKEVSNNGVINIRSNAEVSAVKVDNNGKSTATINLDEKGKLTATESIKNNGKIITNGIITAPKLNNFDDYRIQTFSVTNVEDFQNMANIYYDQQGKKFDYVNVVNKDAAGNLLYNGKSIATILSGDDTNTLADYIINANAFKCTTLEIYPNDNLTTTQWDNSLNERTLNFKNVVMHDGVVIQFNKNLNMKYATVEIVSDATVTWKKGSTLETPIFNINMLKVNSGSTLNVSDIWVENAKQTSVDFGNEGKAVTINGTGCFKVQGQSNVASNSNGTIITTE